MDRKMEVLSLLKQQGSARLTEVAEHLGLTRQGALRHLEALQASGLIEVTQAQPSGPGRPVHVYRLTAAAGDAFPSGHRQLAVELVDFMESTELERFFALRAERLEREYAGRLAGLDFKERVRELARLTREGGHMTEVVERTDGSLQLRHCNCPIQDVAALAGHPCRQEQILYERLLGATVARSTWAGAGDPTCTYDITNNTDERKELG
ncbi:MAG: winged helix-turn-helix transcriptional regulator [Candidatus Dormibacteraeota bacterium]|nr:winged helix-turn-helix transcriptional regulator [Candidatus Dormibacteraeota bacterium]